MEQECLARDNVDEALMAEIRDGINHSNLILQSAREKTIRANRAVEQTLHERDMKLPYKTYRQEEYDRLSREYFGAVRSWNHAVDPFLCQDFKSARIKLQDIKTALKQAEGAVGRAQNAAMQAQAEVQSCYDEISARENLGKLAIDVVRKCREDRTRHLREDIQAIPDRQDQQRVMGEGGQSNNNVMADPVGYLKGPQIHPRHMQLTFLCYRADLQPMIRTY